MRTRSIRVGDLVQVDHKGRLFYARVTGLANAGVLAVEPLDRRVSYRTARAREVVDHWVRVRPEASDKPNSGQLSLDDF